MHAVDGIAEESGGECAARAEARPAADGEARGGAAAGSGPGGQRRPRGKALFFSGEEQTPLTEQTTYGSLSTTLSGTGTTMPTDSVTYTTASEAEITGVYVSAGDTVEVGELLYTQDDSELDDQIEEYQDQITEQENQLDDYQEQLAQLQEEIADPHRDSPLCRPDHRCGRGRGGQCGRRNQAGHPCGRQPDVPDPVFQLRL
ncbi:MAG: biotin/lipoyl-binding protein [Flavonifractor plautii]